MRIRYLINFEKTGALKFIGHLDLLRLFQRLVRLAGLDIGFSNGFNPHQLIFIALPLSVGVSSLSEYVVFEMKTEDSEIAPKLNKVSPEGLKFLQTRLLSEEEKNPSGAIVAADYEVVLGEARNLSGAIDVLLASDTAVVRKVRKDKKHRNREIVENFDIRSLVYDIAQTGENSFDMKIAQGSGVNLKPELVCGFLCGVMGVEYLHYKTAYTRKELYKQTDSGFTRLL